MTRDFIKSSPHFFRLIKVSMGIFLAVLLACAFFIPAPLQEPGNMGTAPNPVKSAWFLLWIQELVSYSKYLIYPVVLLAACFLLLPWLPGSVSAKKAAWLPREQRIVNCFAVAVFSAIMILTIVAMFFRGKNWALTVPF